MTQYRTHNCAELSAKHVGEKALLSGWVHRIRDHGGVLFIDLRDHYGVTQILADPDSPAFGEVEKLRSEYCISIEGEVKKRSAELVNDKIPTGEVEVFITKMEVLSAADELPLMVFGDLEYPEETRLKYRFLDLRREKLQKNMRLRSDVIAALRKRMWAMDFREYQTPIITASSPEGARDFLVPSRLHPNQFYALPQAPQQFKQLLMVAGFDKYFQIAPCFRDEDPRADRSPTDFYQLDMEMSFVTQEDVFATIEPVLGDVFGAFAGGWKVDETWEKIPYKEALELYATDKPDLRNPLKIRDVSAFFRESGFAIFARLLEKEGTAIKAIPAPTGGSRKFCDKMNGFAQKEGLPGMGYIFWREGENGLEAAGPLAKNIGPERSEAIRGALGLEKGDAAFFLGGKPEHFRAFAAKARNVVAEELGLVERERFAFAWIVDFPLYQKNPDTGAVEFEHNPFSMPQGGLDALEGDPLEVLGYQYDLCCNGYELVSGAIRNHRPDIMLKAFEIAGYDAKEVEARFGGMLRAFRYGAPPHGGCAAGIDRIVMLLAHESNIREVMLFPMNQRGEDLMLGAPSEPTPEQLMELGLKLAPREGD